MKEILKLHGVRYSYNGKAILSIDELRIPRGSITGLAGPNGSGKTTLLKLLSGVEIPTTGTVVFHKKNNTGTEARPDRHRLCLLPQDTYLLRRSVYENIAYGIKARGQRGNLDEKVADALALVGLSSSFWARKWNELSGGEAQRVALAARLILKPDCLLLDEPTASVDMESARSIRRAILLARKEWGTTLIIASHHLSWLHDICDQVIYLYNGRVIDCSYENILTGPWISAGEALVSYRLSGGQKVYAKTPPHANSSAVFAPDIFKLNSSVPGNNSKQFKGIVSSVTRENLHAEPQIHVTCGDQRFIVNLLENQLQTMNIIPGQQVTLSYDPHEVTWLE